VRGIQRRVGTLEQIGDHEPRIGHRHRDDPCPQPSGWGERCDQHAERDAAEPGESECACLARETAAIDPGDGKEQRREQRVAWARAPPQPPERKRGE